MDKKIKVPLKKYFITLCIVVVHITIIAILSYYFLPQLQINAILLIGLGYYVFKLINYLVVTIQMKENAFVYNGVFKKGILVPFDEIKEIDLEGPSQFNSNYRLAFYGEIQSSQYKKRKELVKFPIYWFSSVEIISLLKTIQNRNPSFKLHKQALLYLNGESWKNVLINYLIQYSIIAGMVIFIINQYN
jgi:hypothetical protein